MTESAALATVYDPTTVEKEMYALWEQSGAFISKPDGRPHEKTFTIVIPPPNVTGALHLGHALNNTLQDILIRYHRMRGFNTLWQPGTDHAGIATQAVVERRIREQEGKTRHELGREELVRRIWQWKNEYEARIISQLKLMGCSCDWSRNRFTLDEGLARAVRHMFFMLFRDGLIFRGKRLVNWDTQLQTAVADDEVYYDTVKGHFWHFKYPVIPEPRASARADAQTSKDAPRDGESLPPSQGGIPGGSDEPEYVIIATTRPETMLGDTAVAVQPDPEGFFDKTGRELKGMWDRLSSRSQKEAAEIKARLDSLAERRETHLPLLIKLRDMARAGRKVMLPLVEREIPLICDEWADPTKGTGCVKITPAHDPNDYEVGLRHDLPMINVLTPDGRVARIIEPDGDINPNSERYAGLTFASEGRNRVVADLETRGLLEKVEDRETEIGHSDRSKLPIEPFLSDQWFVRTADVPEPRASARANTTNSEPQASARAKAVPEPRASARATSQTSGALPRPSSFRSSHRTRRSPDLTFGATLLTWTTYGTWLPGDERGSVSRAPRADGKQSLRNLPGEPYDHDDVERRAVATKRRAGKAIRLTHDHARVILDCVADTCERHGMELLAVAIMANHVHVLCQGEQHGAEMLQLLKGNASRRLGKQFSLEGSPRWWTKSGSRRRIKRGADLTDAIDYLKAQEWPLLIWSFDVDSGEAARIVCDARRRVQGRGSGERSAHDTGAIAQAEVRGSPGLAQAAMNAVEDGRIGVFPPRYAKSYLDWLSEKRDWCISRQLWWGHRIPVWYVGIDMSMVPVSPDEGLDETDQRLERECIAALHKLFETPDQVGDIDVRVPEYRDWAADLSRFDGSKYVLLCGLGEAQDKVITLLKQFREAASDESLQTAEAGFETLNIGAPHGLRSKILGIQSDDGVLDTWFSSALWPFSTLGWPDETPHLKQYYPTTVLCTSRDIITNWVARMVMFGLYARGEVPFDHVYIHPKILDGRGETMSKSKGNGVDPVDVIHTHGGDALRYAMADMCTETQDIRMPVEYVCPHCAQLTDQTAALAAEEQSRKSRGITLDRGLQPADITRVKCRKKDCGREFATQWADQTLKNEFGVGRETSDKFDIGRNFCNKLWNAARFAFMNLPPEPQASACANTQVSQTPRQIDLLPEDRWILARLSQTIRRYHECLANYQFSTSVRELRDFFWESLCDWYVELTKPRLTEPRASARANVPDTGATQDAERSRRLKPAARDEDPARRLKPAAHSEPHVPDTGATQDAERSRRLKPAAQTTQEVLAFCLDQTLRLFHPTIPFITERLWQQLNAIVPQRSIPGGAALPCEGPLILAEFPPLEGYPDFDDERILATFAQLQDATRAVRDLRSQCNVSPKDKVNVTVVVPGGVVEDFKSHAHVVRHMANIDALHVTETARRPPNAASMALHGLRIYVHDISDDDAERKRTTKALEVVEKQIAAKESKLRNEKFLQNAKPDIVQAERDRLDDLRTQQAALRDHLAELQNGE